MKKYELTLVKEDGFPITNKDGYPLHRLEIEAESPEQACESFIKSHKPLPFGKINITWNYGWSYKNFDPPHYKGHKAETETDQSEGLGDSTVSNPSSIDQTQEEILKQLKQINWGIRVGFLFIMLVVTGIIKPGIFG